MEMGEITTDEFPIHEWKWERSPPMNSATNMTWDTISQNLSGVGTYENRNDREADEAVHWRLINQKLRFGFLKNGGDIFTDRDLIYHYWKGKDTLVGIC